MANKKRKQKTQIMMIGLVAIFLLVIGFYIQSFSVVDDLPTAEKYVEAPVFGYLKCLPTQNQLITEMMRGEYAQVVQKDSSIATPYTCKDFLGMVDGCSITMTVTEGLDNWHDTTAELVYQVIPAGTEFRDKGEILSGGIGGYKSNQRVTVQLTDKDVVWVRYTEGKGLLSQRHINDKVRFDVQGVPYTIYNVNQFDSRSGQVLEGARLGNCYLEEEYYKTRKIQYVSAGIIDETRSLDWTHLNRPNGVYTYLAGFTPVPQFGSRVEAYNGKPAYCMNNAMYEIKSIRVNDFTYSIVNFEKSGFIESVTCCNGDERPDMICVNNEWVEKNNIECDLNKGLFCPQSTYQPFGTTSYKRYQCVENKCVEDVLEVKCTFPNNGCATGEVCVVDENPANNYCVEHGTGGNPVCGDGKCHKGLEDDPNSAFFCPLDCNISGGTGGLNPTLVFIVLGFVLLILLMVVVKMRMSKGKGGVGF